jgi:catechol 2,3-dioxygenase
VADRVKLGHVHLKVRDLDAAEEFYVELLGMQVRERVGGRFSFLSSGGGAHHDLALQALGSGAPGPAFHGVGLGHLAFELPSREAFADAWRRLREMRREAAAADHRISWSIYCADPAGNAVELYVDTRADVGGASLWRGASVPLDEATILAHRTEARDGEPAVVRDRLTEGLER